MTASPFLKICSAALTLVCKALLTLSLDSVCIHVFFASSKTFKCCANASLLVVPLRAGSLSVIMPGKFGFSQMLAGDC